MNSSTLPRIGIACALLLYPVSRLTAQDLPSPQNKTLLLQELDKIASGSDALTQKRRAEAISRIQAASSSGSAAVDLYASALDNTKYRDNHQDFVDWRLKKQNELHHPSFQNAAQLQLRYLLLALQRSDQKTAFLQVPDVMAYLNSLTSLHFLEEPYTPQQENRGGKGGKAGPTPPAPADKVIPEAAALIRQPLPNCAVVEWFQISDLLPQGKDFHPSAGDFSGIIEKNVKSPLRATNDTRLPGVWDFQINAQSAATSTSSSTETQETFRNEQLPALIFGKLKDTAAIGQPNRALNEMMNLIRAYPSNPSLDDWIETARRLLTNTPATPASVTPPAITGTNVPAAATNSPTAAPSNSPAAP